MFFDTAGTGMTADDLAAKARARGLMFSTMGRYRGRACTHLDVDGSGVAEGLQILREVLAA